MMVEPPPVDIESVCVCVTRACAGAGYTVSRSHRHGVVTRAIIYKGAHTPHFSVYRLESEREEDPSKKKRESSRES